MTMFSTSRFVVGVTVLLSMQAVAVENLAQRITSIADPDHSLGRLGEALALLRLADEKRIGDAGLDAAAIMLGDSDLFVQGVAEWAIATRVGRDNKDFAVVWPKTPSPAWYQTWNDVTQERRAEMDWVRQAVSLGLHLDGKKLRASADALLRRAKALTTASGSDGAARRRAEASHMQIQSLIKAMDVPGVTVDDMCVLWLKARRVLRPAVLASVPATCDQVLFSTVFAPHNTPNVVGTHTSFTYKPGGDLCVLSGLRSGNIKVHPLLAGKLGKGHVHGLDLWFDADRVVFAWARQEGWPFPKGCDKPPSMGIWGGAKTAQHELRLCHEPPHLFEIRLDGSSLKQLTDDPYWSDVEPIWLPDGGVAFTSDRCGHGVICDCFCNDLLNLNLYVRAPDGGIRLLSNNKDIDRHPALLDNGLIIYTRWEYQERNFYDIHSLWTVRPDGTMADAFFKQHLLRPMGLRDARPVPGSTRQVAIATGHHTYAYGPVVLIDASAGMNSANAIRSVTPEAKELEAPTALTPVAEGGVRDAGGLYQTPCALSATCFLAPYSYPAPKTDGGVEANGFGLYVIDVYGNKELIYRDPVLGVAYPLPLRKRLRPVLPDTTKPSQPWATCVLSDVQAGMGPEVKPGTVKWLRISEALPWPMDALHGSYKWAWGNAWEANPAQTTWNPVRVIGLVPVEADGSAHFQVPAVHAASVYFQALDASYCEVRRMRSNVSFQPGETRSCYGCHETQAVSSSAHATGHAAAAPACRPTPPSWGADRALGYEWLIQPVLDRRCMPCHDGTDKRTTCDLTARKVKTAERELNQSYVTLMGGNICGDGRGNGKDGFVWISNRFSDGSVTKSYEFGSTRSALIQILKKGHYEVKLDPDEWLRLVTWVDANGIYHDRFIDKRPADGGAPRRDAEFRWPDPFNATGGQPWRRIDDGAKAVPLPVKGHAFIGSDPRLNKVVMVSDKGEVTWEYQSDTVVDVAVLTNGHFLVSNLHGAQEVTPDKRVVWEYCAPTNTEVFSCQPLSEGAVLVCESGTKRLVEVNREGKVTKEIRLESGQDRHNQFRIARKTVAGTYLVAYHGDNLVRELDGEGRCLRTIRTPGNAYMADRLPNGNTLIACGDGHTLVEVDPQDKVVWELKENDLPGNPLRFAGGFQHLDNGNLLLCNWPCHGFEGQQPLVVEVTRDKKVVWQWSRPGLRGIVHLALLPKH